MSRRLVPCRWTFEECVDRLGPEALPLQHQSVYLQLQEHKLGRGTIAQVTNAHPGAGMKFEHAYRGWLKLRPVVRVAFSHEMEGTTREKHSNNLLAVSIHSLDPSTASKKSSNAALRIA